MAHIDPAAAENCHYATDPRIRHLAEARWRMETGGSRMDWLCLGKDNPEALIREAREWVRAAVAGGLLEAPSDDPAWKTAAHRAAEAGPHSCSNCDGVDPDTCLMNPDRPPERCPAAEFEDYGRQCEKPAGHNLCSFEEEASRG